MELFGFKWGKEVGEPLMCGDGLLFHILSSFLVFLGPGPAHYEIFFAFGMGTCKADMRGAHYLHFLMTYVCDGVDRFCTFWNPLPTLFVFPDELCSK